MSVESLRCYSSLQNWKVLRRQGFVRGGGSSVSGGFVNCAKLESCGRRARVLIACKTRQLIRECGSQRGVSGLWQGVPVLRECGMREWSQRMSKRRVGKAQCGNFSLVSESSDGAKKILDNDSEEDAPMRKSNVVVKLLNWLRLVVRSVKKWSPEFMIGVCSSFVQRHWKHVLFWTVVGSTVGLACLCASFGGALPKVVSYSELVDHLHTRTVTNALFEEGSRQVYFNVHSSDAERNGEQVVEDVTPAVIKDLSSDTSVVSHTEQSVETFDKLQRESIEAMQYNKVSSSDGKLWMKGLPVQPVMVKGQSQKWQFSTRRIGNDEAFLLSLMRDGGVKYSSAPQSMSATLKAVLITIITLWIPLSPLLWLLHRQLSQQSAAAKQKRRPTSRLIKFDDVAGVDSAKAELMEIVSCIKGTSKFASLGAKLPKGVLLVGPPGTGKTLLARAVAGEAGVPFFAASASEFVEMFVGRGAARIRELFSEARKCTPSIVFIDELDAVGGQRGRSFNDERDQTLNQLLTEMDGFDSEAGVLVLAATNRPSALDPALCRPGRINRRVYVAEPDVKGRQQVLAVHMREVPVREDPVVLQRVVASMTSGFVGADLANLVNEAALLAARKGRSAVMLEDFKEAVYRVKYGVGDRRQSVLEEMEQKFGAIFGKFRAEEPDGYAALPFSGG